jgi:hypothetical protein
MEVLRDGCHQQAGRRVQHGDVDPLAAAGTLASLQRGDRADHGVQAGEIVRHDRAADRGRAVGRPRQLLETGQRLDHRIVGGAFGPGPFLAEAGDPYHDQPWIDFLQRFPAEAHILHHAGTEVLHQDVGPGDEFPQHRLAVLVAQIDRQAALGAVDGHEKHAVGLADLGIGHAHAVAGQALDLDHVGAGIAHHLGRVRTGGEARQVEDADSLQRPAHAPPRSGRPQPAGVSAKSVIECLPGRAITRPGAGGVCQRTAPDAMKG